MAPSGGRAGRARDRLFTGNPKPAPNKGAGPRKRIGPFHYIADSEAIGYAHSTRTPLGLPFGSNTSSTPAASTACWIAVKLLAIGVRLPFSKSLIVLKPT
jgi:hypothetical protein